jgi:putative oxidoreductase
MDNNKLKFYGGWALKGLAGAAFIAAGGSKLLGTEQMVQLFSDIGFGQWFRSLTGLIEVVSAVLLFIPGLAILGAALLMSTMIGAILTHLLLIGGSAVPALVLLLLCTAIAWLHRDQIPGSVRRGAAA